MKDRVEKDRANEDKIERSIEFKDRQTRKRGKVREIQKERNNNKELVLNE